MFPLNDAQPDEGLVQLLAYDAEFEDTITPVLSNLGFCWFSGKAAKTKDIANFELPTVDIV